MVMLGGVRPLTGLLLVGAGDEGVEVVVGAGQVTVAWQREPMSRGNAVVVQGDLEVGVVHLVEERRALCIKTV